MHPPSTSPCSARAAARPCSVGCAGDVQVAMVTVPRDLVLAWQLLSGCSRDATRNRGEHGGASGACPVCGASRARHQCEHRVDAQNSLPAGSWAGKVHEDVSLCCFPEASSIRLHWHGKGVFGRAGGNRHRKSVCLNRLFLERAFSCLFMREEFHALASKAEL